MLSERNQEEDERWSIMHLHEGFTRGGTVFGPREQSDGCLGM